MGMKFKPWSSKSDWFLPFHLVMMIVVAFFIYIFI